MACLQMTSALKWASGFVIIDEGVFITFLVVVFLELFNLFCCGIGPVA